MKKILPLIRRGLFTVLSAIGLNTPTRIVIALSPFFVSASGYIVALAGKYLPLLPALDQAQVNDLFMVGAAAMASKLVLWLRGAQKLEQSKLPTTVPLGEPLKAHPIEGHMDVFHHGLPDAPTTNGVVFDHQAAPDEPETVERQDEAKAEAERPHQDLPPAFTEVGDDPPLPTAVSPAPARSSVPPLGRARL